MKKNTVILFLCILASVAWQCIATDDDDDSFYYGKGPLPRRFRRGQRYPNRDEEFECRPIQIHVARGTKRFLDLVMYTGNKIHFASADSRIMSSRLHSRLSSLADQYYNEYKIKLYVLKAWVPYPDYSLDNTSLHYEGRSISIHVTSSNVTRLLKLAVSLKFDWVIYDNNGYARLSVIPDICESNIDMVFVMDQSGSIGKNNHQLALQFLKKVVEFYTVGPNLTQIGLVTYSTNARVRFDLNDFHTKKDILDRISNIRYPGGWTATALGLFQAGVILNPTQKRGARPIEDGIPRVVVLLTDGRSNLLPIDEAATSLHDFGVQVYTVGIGNIFLPELKFIASDPDPYHVFLLDSFTDAEGFVDLLSIETCGTPAVVKPGENTTTEVPEDGFRFFQAECTAFSAYVMVEQVDLSGLCSLYASSIKPNPVPLDSNSTVMRNEDHNTNKRSIILTGVKKFIYISVRGVRTKNVFTVIIWDRLFHQESYTIDAPEDVVGVSIFNFNQQLSVITERFFYYIKDGNDGNHFTIDNTTSNLIIHKRLNLSIQSYYQLLVIAENQNASCHRGKLIVKINVVPNELQIPNLDPVSIPENSTGGTNVSQITAVGAVTAVLYSITAGNTNDAFVIDEQTGLISVSSPPVLNFETIQQYQLTIQARLSQGVVSATGTLIVNIIDINEPPVFITSCAIANNCAFSVFENVSIPNVITSIIANDPDLPSLRNGRLNYFIVPSTIQVFIIDNNGRLTVNRPLDRESRNTYNFDVLVQDDGSPNLSIQTSVSITVLDSNDNAPVFIRPTLTHDISESVLINTMFAQYSAVDRDIGINAQITFSLQSNIPNLPFSIDPNNGAVSVTGPLDADEGIQTYSVTVVASNFDGLSSSVDITINILDANDNAPQFLQLPITGMVTENAANGTFVVQVNATDIDSGLNGEVRYSIIQGNIFDSFVIDEITGRITVNANIDRETTSVFNLTIEASDRGSVPMINTTHVIIRITDINDNAPVFLPSVLFLTFPENQPLGSLDITLMATDRDEVNTLNSEIRYSIIAGNVGDKFSINSQTGVLSLESMLDFEQRDTFNLTIRGNDLGTPVMSGSALVHVTVTNVNEHTPVISGDITIEVPENEALGTTLAQFTATDLDQMTIEFCFTTPSNFFAIDRRNGTVTLINTLDFETTRQYTLTVKASDSVHSDNATLTINVIDINEFQPEFIEPLMFSVDEEESPSTTVGTIQAVDEDGSGNTVTYFFDETTVSQLFNLNPNTGLITTAVILDRESLVEENFFLPPESREILKVIACDSGEHPGPLCSMENITIQLNDINDNNPVFELQRYTRDIPENRVDTVTLFTVVANDIDIGNNSLVSYSLQGSGSDNFNIGPTSGIVTAIRPLDRETVDVYNLIILATDKGLVPRTSTVSAIITVTDINDNPPVFTQNEYTISIPESTLPGTAILTVITTDDDQPGINTGVTYAIDQSDSCSPLPSPIPSFCFFSVNNSGTIELIRQLDFETNSQHNFTVIATDTGIPMLSTGQLVTVNVLNVDESPPTFTGPCNASVFENVSLNTVITTCPATDFDEVSGLTTNNIRYFIIQGNEDQTFSIDDDGIITNVLPLDREKQSSYNLLIRIVDSNSLQADMEVEIIVLDVNDNAPQFVNEPYSAFILDSEVENYRTSIISISATDRDIGANGQVVYSITGSPVKSQNETTFTVTAADQGEPTSLSNTTIITVGFESYCELQEYSIDASSGQITGIFLCRIVITPRLLAVSVGQDLTLQCNVLRNIDVQVQFIHNGSFVGSTDSLALGNNEVILISQNVTFFDAGLYDCRATSTLIMGLQTELSSTVEIQVPARITVGPRDLSANEFQPQIIFRCVADGVPDPVISWLKSNQVLEVSANVVPIGGQLLITDITTDDEGIYTCRADNPAGSDTSSAKLSVFGALSVVIAEVVNLYQPDPILVCNSFDMEGFQETLNGALNQEVMATSVNGDSLCASDACHPNPCINGTCNVTDDGGYVCTCIPGFIGEQCDEDIDECQGLLCLNGGSCENVHGGFICHCPDGFHGEMCEYLDDGCACLPGTECLIIGNTTSCLGTPTGISLTIEDPVVNNIAQLDNTINTLLENPSSTSSGSLSKRNTYATVCSGRFVRLQESSNTYTLVWVCPDDAQPPSNDDLYMMCTKLINLQLVRRCHPPEGPSLQFPTIPPSDVEVSFVLFDSNGDIMSSSDALQILKNSDAINILRQKGFNTVEFREAPVPMSSSQVGGTVSSVVIVLILLVLVSAVISVFVAIRCKRTKRQLVPVMEMDEKPTTIVNMVIENNYVTKDTAITGNENPYTLYNEPVRAAPQATPVVANKRSTLERAKQHHLQRTNSSEKLLDSDDDEKAAIDDEPIYANMQIIGNRNVKAGTRWENYWKTETLFK